MVEIHCWSIRFYQEVNPKIKWLGVYICPIIESRNIKKGIDDLT